jgi:hypothetical protein
MPAAWEAAYEFDSQTRLMLRIPRGTEFLLGAAHLSGGPRTLSSHRRVFQLICVRSRHGRCLLSVAEADSYENPRTRRLTRVRLLRTRHCLKAGIGDGEAFAIPRL